MTTLSQPQVKTNNEKVNQISRLANKSLSRFRAELGQVQACPAAWDRSQAQWKRYQELMAALGAIGRETREFPTNPS